MGYCPWSRKELDMTEQLIQHEVHTYILIYLYLKFECILATPCFYSVVNII